ncbi:MAG: YIP1 family protein [Chloroflexota bacterium]|nr:YIP1 family protein [Chloroflexota bacterium]
MKALCSDTKSFDLARPVILDLVHSVLVSPAKGITMVTSHRPMGWGGLLIVLVFFVVVISLYRGSVQLINDVLRIEVLGDVVVWILLFVVGLLIAALVLHLCSRMLGGNGSYGGLASGLCFSCLPLVLLAPITILHTALGVESLTIWGLSVFIIVLWGFVLAVIAVRENYAFSYKRAVAVHLMPLTILAAGSILLFLVAFFIRLL